MFEKKYRAFHNTKIKSTTIHETYCGTFMNRNPKSETGVWQEGTQKEIEARAKELGHKLKTHTRC